MTAEPTTADAGQSRATSRRSWRQFSLRTLLLVMLVLSVCLALFAWRLERAREQAAAVATIRKLGGEVRHDYHFKEEGHYFSAQVPRANSPYPDWLVTGIGEDFFHRVVCVSHGFREPNSEEEIHQFWQSIQELRDSDKLQANDGWLRGKESLEALRHHDRLQMLALTQCNLIGGDLQPLRGLKSLRSVFLRDNVIVDEGAEHLATLASLAFLDVERNGIGDEGVQALCRGCTNLEMLGLGGNPVTDRGLARLNSLSRLRTLSLDETMITDAALAPIGKIPTLECLSLHSTSISDEGLGHLAALVNLERIYLNDTQVTGTGADQLGRLVRLRSVAICGTTTEDGVASLLKLPSLRHLDLRKSSIPAEGWARMTWPDGLESVVLDDTRLTDDGLMRLAECRTLSSCSIFRTQVTAEGVHRLKQARPNVYVHGP